MEFVQSLARLQFALTIMFHYLFPPLSIGLSALMVLMEGTYLWTRDRRYHEMTRYWTRLFAVNFAMGVATGIVMEFQFGTNWANFSRYVGDVFGSALAAEGIFAFFLESGFLAVLVFGWDRVSARMHFIATVMVSLGSIFSAVWIVVANSWMQTPAGFEVVTETAGSHPGARAVVTDFWAVVLNPSTVQRLTHTLLGAFVLGAFFVMSISAFYILRGRHLDFARRSFTLALLFGTVVTLALAVSGHFNARMVAREQPAKLAAFEGVYHTGRADLHLVGWPDADAERVDYSLDVPGGLSFLAYDDFDHPLDGLDRFDPADRPPVLIPFLSYHVMIGVGTALVVLVIVACFLRWRGTLFDKRWLMWVFVFAVLGPYLANQAGWVAAEVGRQPFVVYPQRQKAADGSYQMAGGKYVLIGGLRTVQGLSNIRVVPAESIGASIALFSLVYLLLFGVWVYVMNSKIQHGPDEDHVPAPPATSPGQLMETASIIQRRGDGRSLTEVRLAPEQNEPRGPADRG
jgi:cytochrome d ubiquinol oxidase subunit I